MQPIVLQHPCANQDFIIVNKGRYHTNPVSVKRSVEAWVAAAVVGTTAVICGSIQAIKAVDGRS